MVPRHNSYIVTGVVYWTRKILAGVAFKNPVKAILITDTRQQRCKPPFKN